MNNDRNISELEQLNSRKYLLEKQLNEMKNRIMGRSSSFYPFIVGRSGRISEKKLMQFIDELLKLPQKYSGRSLWLELNSSPTLRELCECFLYCAIQGIAVYNEGEKYVERPACFFSDITDIAAHKNNLFLIDEGTLHGYEFASGEYDTQKGECKYYDEFNEGGFFRNSDLAYYILTGKHIVSTFPSDEYKQRCHARELQIANEHGYDSYEEYQRSMENAQEELEKTDISDLPEDMECVNIDEDNELFELQKSKNEEWKKSVVSPEKFAKKYLRFRQLFFAQTKFVRYHLFEEIELLVDIFLYEHKLSVFSEEDVCAMIYYRTDRLCASLERSTVGGSER